MSKRLTPDDVIRLAGGVAEIAARLGKTKAAVHRWRTAGRIPRWHWDALIAMAAEHGNSLTHYDLMEASYDVAS